MDGKNSDAKRRNKRKEKLTVNNEGQEYTKDSEDNIEDINLRPNVCSVEFNNARKDDELFPRDLKSWLKYPGVGEYTAGAILSIAYGLPIPAVDGNVIRYFLNHLYIHIDAKNMNF